MIQDALLLCAKRLAEVLLKLSNMKNTLEFEIPDGYELDKDNSTAKKSVYKKVDKYEPKEGDLVYAECNLSSNQKFIFIYGVTNSCSIDNLRGRWEVEFGQHWIYNTIRPATPEEAKLFTRIMSENGYEYDPEKKEARKKRWRAKVGQRYWFIDETMRVRTIWDYRIGTDYSLYKSGNYFRTREEAEEVAAEFRKILNNRK